MAEGSSAIIFATKQRSDAGAYLCPSPPGAPDPGVKDLLDLLGLFFLEQNSRLLSLIEATRSQAGWPRRLLWEQRSDAGAWVFPVTRRLKLSPRKAKWPDRLEIMHHYTFWSDFVYSLKGP